MPSSPARARFVLLHSASPQALFAHAAAPFCVKGRLTERPPLLALRQGGIRDELHERAARAGCSGWVGKPVVVFAELPGLIAGDTAPLGAFERRALIEDLLERTPLKRLAGARKHRGFTDAVDRLFGDLASERIGPDSMVLPDERDAWAGARDAELRALYAAYLNALARLPKVDGVARTDGRDGFALAADAIRNEPDAVRARLRRPFGDDGEPVTVAIYGLNDLRRGWDLLLDALREAPFVDELRVYLSLDHVTGEDAARDRDRLEAIGEHELLDALLARQPDEIVRVPDAAGPDALAPLRRALFRADGGSAPHDAATPVRAVAAPDLAREVDDVARRVKRMIVEQGVAPHTIAVVSRKSRPYGPRAVDALRRHGVPVSARTRTNLTEVSAVAALLRVYRAAGEGFAWRTLAELAESPYFDLELDVGLLRRAGTRARIRTLDAWTQALDAMVEEASRDRGLDEHRAPDVERARAAAASFAAFRAEADVIAKPRARAEWIALALSHIGRGADGERARGLRPGLWSLCANACRLPHDESDDLLVEATRRDIEALDCLGGLLGEWRAALPLRADAAGEKLSPREWHAELAQALGDVEITLSTPHRRGVQVLEASAAVWRGFDHLFLVGMSAGDFPAEPAGRELYAEHEREARYARGLPLDPARVWFAREASLLRTLVGGTRKSLQVSYAYADANGGTQIPSAYFDEIGSRYTSTKPEGWVEAQPGSRVAPAALDDVWCTGDLQLFAARGWSDAARRAEASIALAQLAGDPARRALVERVLAAAGAEHERRALRLDPPESRADLARRFNGRITSPDLVAALDARFADAVWSASQLEAYGRCPFTFFMRYVLDVRSAEEPDEEMDGATRGQLVHVCLDRLHARLAADMGDDALTARALDRAEKLIPAIVARALDEFEQTGRGGLPVMRGVRERELTELLGAYVRWEVAENEKAQRRATPRRRPLMTEVTFGMDGKPPVSLQHMGRVLRLRGKIDRVDELTDPAVLGWRYVVDHKTGDHGLSPLDLYDEGALLQLPLYMLALERMGEGGDGVWGGAYQVVKDACKRAAPLHPRTLERGGTIREGSNVTEQAAAARTYGALPLALFHVDAIRRGEFPARLPKCSKACPTYCDTKDVCREDRAQKAGPRR